ncbi:MAG: 50S ribosomal protein L16 [bacterium]|nr:50S ribosomal protein L16 [bacterium]
MLIPKKVKHRKWQKGRRRRTGIATRRTNLDFGNFGLKAMTNSWVTARQIEAARRAVVHFIKKGGQVWIRIFPDKPITNHGNESVMGGGKGAVDHYVAPVKPGTVLLEIGGVSEKDAREAMRLASHKLPVITKIVAKF